MANLTEQERNFFDRVQSKGTKKISLNMSSDSLERIDELAAIFNMTRTLLIESLLRTGLHEYLSTIESANRKIKKDHPGNKQLDQMLKNIAAYRKKWDIQKE